MKSSSSVLFPSWFGFFSLSLAASNLFDMKENAGIQLVYMRHAPFQRLNEQSL
jgi:hypothetical protein